MLSERQQCCYQSSIGENMGSVAAVTEAEYGEWPNPNYTVADASETVVHLKMGDAKSQQIATHQEQKRSTILDSFNKVVKVMFSVFGNGMKPVSHPSPMMTAKAELCKNTSSSPCLPIFETTKSGKGQLTVPLDYSSTVDDISMTPAGVYIEEMERPTSRPGRRKRRKNTAKGNQHAMHGTSEGGSGAKGCGKNRKEKKRHALRRDIFNDNLALVDDSSYGYDFREAAYSNGMETNSHSHTQRCLSSSFSPSLTGSVESFHDALQDIVSAESLHLNGSSGSVRSVPVSVCGSLTDNIAVRKQPSFNESVETVVGEQTKEKGDNEPRSWNGFVVFSNYDVFTTPSASPARRRPPPSLCQTIRNVWHNQQQHSDDSSEEEDDQSEYNSEDISDDEGDYGNRATGLDDDDDDDDDSIVFCEDYDDLNDDSNSSSGFEERKVRFNAKPVVHVMRAWDFAYRQARKGEWEMAARDRERFRNRIADLEPVIGPALQPALRDKIYSERFSGKESTRKILQ